MPFMLPSPLLSSLSRPLTWRSWLPCALILVLFGAAAGVVDPWLEYQRSALEQGQWWRLWSAHWVHANLAHALLNVSGFVLCCLVFSDLYRRHTLLLWWLLTPPLLSAALWIGDGLEGPYVGLSGVLHSWLLWALVVGLPGHPRLHGVLLLALGGRLLWEQLPGYDSGYLSAWVPGSVYVNAHLYGAVLGLVGGLASLVWRRRSAR